MDKTELITSIKAMTAEERVKTAYTTMDEEILTILSEDKRWFVREVVASNPNTITEILEFLADDEDYEVREAVAENEHTPIALLIKLAEDISSDVRAAVVRNKNTPSDTLVQLTQDERFYVSITARKALEGRKANAKCNIEK